MPKLFKKLKKPLLIHLFFTTRLSVLFYLISNNPIHVSKIPITLVSIVISLLGSPIRLLQRLIFNKKIRQISFENHPPLFIIGHFRSGTTYLHTLMSKDRKYSTPTIYHALFINYCLIGGKWLKRLLSPLMPKQRIQDRVVVTLDEPDEEEIALFGYSPYNGLTDYFFPKNTQYHNKYILLQTENDQSKNRWRKYYNEVLRIISYSVGNNRLLLKNPFNTTRTLELSQLFPGAKFVFIIRNPYEIYVSTQHWYKTLILPLSLQILSETELEDRIVGRFKAMMKKYLKERDKLPRGSVVEITFEALQKDSISVVSAIYEELELPGLDTALPIMEAYLSSVKNYNQNRYDPLPDRIVKRINKEWDFVFDEWAYPKICV